MQFVTYYNELQSTRFKQKNISNTAGWWCGIVVRTSVLEGDHSLSHARLSADG